MKRLLSYATLALILSIAMVSCNTNSPKAVANKFLTSFYHMDFDAARKVSTDDTKKMLDMWQQLTPMIPDSAKQTLKKTKVTIKDVKEQGDTATVTYVTSDNPKDQPLHLVKQKGQWLVQWTKQDQMNGAGDENQPSEGDQQQPPVSDTSAPPAPNPTATPQSTDTTMAK
ncbi:MAG TPA: hypothetical protein VN721_15775 [Flavipsychrobacter sp.]|nr:hypothetical protein [Flavipsychrobacter sp.]